MKFFIEGNNGGDYLRLWLREDGRVNIEVAHCCVPYFCGVVPTEVLTSILARSLGNWPIEEWDLPWSKEINKSILERVEE